MKPISDFLNQIILGDCLRVMKEIPNESIDLVLTDPPYNISSDLKISMSNHVNGNSNERLLTYDFGEWDNFVSDDAHIEFTKKWMQECYRVLKPEGNFVTFFANWLTGDLKRIWESFGGRARQKLYWQKTNPKPRLRKVDFQHGIEELFWGAKSDSNHVFNYELGQQVNYITTAVFYNNERTSHPTQKPEKTVGWIINYLSKKDAIVLDPFCGSGTIPYVSIANGRRFIGIEQDQHWVDVSRKRIDFYSKPIKQISNLKVV